MPTGERYLTAQVIQDLTRKMVFVGGPRQVGKTTLAKALLGKNQKGYFNWDDPHHREQILKRELPEVPLWVFDEIHKYRGWRNYLKGLYDVQGAEHEILVTGSARLDYYRRGGDSLQGRYHYLRLHPLSVAELKITSQSDFENLLTLGGFPEPYFQGSAIEAKRWSREYRQRLIQENLIGLEQVQDLGNLELLMLRLPELVGSPLSVNALREDLQVSHKAVSNWLDILERLYAIFRLSPFGSPKIRGVKKEQKHYHYDWSLVEDTAFRFENLVAEHLLKWVHYRQDTRGEEIELVYFRDIDGREVDFVVTQKKRPLWAIECKSNDTELHRGLKYFKERFPACEAWQLTAAGKKDYVSGEGIRVCPARIFLERLV
ncbi:MAG TPA: AAA family ATPase [Deltaproteobacteria bacterium]|nr:AAA family ATPase [Deltaproteobacteria bacterium]